MSLPVLVGSLGYMLGDQYPASCRKGSINWDFVIVGCVGRVGGGNDRYTDLC